MSTERKLSISLYALAFVITIIIFLTGIYVGTEMSKSVNAKVMGEVNAVSQSTLSLQLLLLMEPSVDFCPVFSEELQKLHGEMTLLGDKLSYIETVNGDSDPELKKEYFKLELSSYLLRTRVKELCGEENPIILYFYSNENCGEPCSSQGEELTKLRESEKVILYTFDGTLDSSVVKALKTKFGISTYPTLIINEEKFTGLKTKTQILNILTK